MNFNGFYVAIDCRLNLFVNVSKLKIQDIYTLPLAN